MKNSNNISLELLEAFLSFSAWLAFLIDAYKLNVFLMQFANVANFYLSIFCSVEVGKDWLVAR